MKSNHKNMATAITAAIITVAAVFFITDIKHLEAGSSGVSGLPSYCVYEEISTAAQLFALSGNVDEAALRKNYILTDDIDLSAYNWEPIGYPNNTGTGGKTFTGVFDGRGHTITGIKRGVSPSGWNRAFFGTIGESAVVRNTKFDGYLRGNSYISGLFVKNYGYVEDCIVDIDILALGGNAFAIGQNNYGLVENLIVLGCPEVDETNAKALFGTNEGTVNNLYADSDEVLTQNFTGAGGALVLDDGEYIYSHEDMMESATYAGLSDERWNIAGGTYPMLNGHITRSHDGNTFFDDFTNGVDKDYWRVGNQKWGTGNGGVIYQNLSYLGDGMLVLGANGDYYAGSKTGIGNSHGRRTGSAIISRDYFGPGRFEVRAKIMPRFGGATAFWTYYNDGTVNHEIDIELNVSNDFHNSWFTNWLTESNYVSMDMKTPVLHNDGQYHTYRFDWHTGTSPSISYYIDGTLYHTATTHVPTNAMQMWIGIWFPNGWAGTPDFETDGMYVDYFRHTAFSGESYTAHTRATASLNAYYPSAPTAYTPANLVSNPSYGSDLGWTKTGTVSTNGGTITLSSGSLQQTVSGVSHGMDLSLSATVTSSVSILISYLNSSGTLISSLTSYGASDFYAPVGCKYIVVKVQGTGTCKDLFMNLQNR